MTHPARGTKRGPFTNSRHNINETGIYADLHIIDKPQVKGFNSFGGKRLIKLQLEAQTYDCEVKRDERGRRKHQRSYIFTSCDTGPAGAECRTLDEVDEELDNFRG